MENNNPILLIRYDGLFLIGQRVGTDSYRLTEPAMVLFLPVQVQSRLANQPGVGYQTSIVFIGSQSFIIPAGVGIIPTELEPSEPLAVHYYAQLRAYKGKLLHDSNVH